MIQSLSGIFYLFLSKIFCLLGNIWQKQVFLLDVIISNPYYIIVILSFKCKETEKIWNQERSLRFPVSIQRIALRKLFMLHRAKELQDLRIPPANRLERLKGARIGQYSIRINDQWRICFIWNNANASDVEIVDYH